MKFLSLLACYRDCSAGNGSSDNLHTYIYIHTHMHLRSCRHRVGSLVFNYNIYDVPFCFVTSSVRVTQS